MFFYFKLQSKQNEAKIDPPPLKWSDLNYVF